MKVKISKEQAKKNFVNDVIECLIIAVSTAATFFVAILNIGKMLNYDTFATIVVFAMFGVTVVNMYILFAKVYRALWNRFPKIRVILEKIR